jgi:hypothetical protein
MDATFERKANKQEWNTPKWVLEDLGHFELDPCAAENPLFKIADKTYNERQNGLTKEWKGRVFMNPPYDRGHSLEKFIDKLIKHGNGIALLFCRVDTAIWQDKILPNANSILFLRGRVSFLQDDGTSKGPAGAPSALVSFGEENDAYLFNKWAKSEGKIGFYVKLKD